MKFAMPMVKDFVPKAVRPWLYVVMALCFQVSAARYLGALNEIIGATAQMREDVLMCLYCNLAGMALWFPMLFRMKFRFTNKMLLVPLRSRCWSPTCSSAMSRGCRFYGCCVLLRE